MGQRLPVGQAECRLGRPPKYAWSELNFSAASHLAGPAILRQKAGAQIESVKHSELSLVSSNAHRPSRPSHRSAILDALVKWPPAHDARSGQGFGFQYEEYCFAAPPG